MSGEIEHYHRLACGDQRFEEALLGVGQGEHGAACRFAARFGGLSQGRHYHISLFCRCKGFGEQLIFAARVAHGAAEYGALLALWVGI